MRRLLGFISTLFILLLVSCASTTKDFIKGPAFDENLTIDEKLEVFGGVPIQVDYPEIIYDGTEWLKEITELVNEAEDYILISSFLSSFSDPLQDFFNTLIKKAEEGVKVYFIMDGTSSYDMTETREYLSPLYYLRDYGINLLEFGPLSGLRLVNPTSLIRRDHRKLIVVDGKVSALGGMNINYISIGAGDGATQRDSMFVFHSPDLAEKLIKEYVSIWNDSSIDKISVDMFPVEKNDDEETYLNAWLFNNDENKRASISGMYSTLINNAENYVLMLPYLPLLNKDMKSAVKNAVDRGVEVDMLLPVDLRGYAKKGLAYEFERLIKSTDANIYLTIHDNETNALEPILHEKLTVVDDRWVVIGSTNFNLRSMDLSNEIALVIESPELADKFKNHVEEIIRKASFPLSLEDAKLFKKNEASWASYIFMYFGG